MPTLVKRKANSLIMDNFDNKYSVIFFPGYLNFLIHSGVVYDKLKMRQPVFYKDFGFAFIRSIKRYLFCNTKLFIIQFLGYKPRVTGSNIVSLAVV